MLAETRKNQHLNEYVSKLDAKRRKHIPCLIYMCFNHKVIFNYILDFYGFVDIFIFMLLFLSQCFLDANQQFTI